MKKIILILITLSASFVLGFAFKTYTINDNKNELNKKRVTGIGGIFFKCKSPKKMNEWYHKHLGLNTNDYGVSFEWYQLPDSTKKGLTQWNTFAETTNYFKPSTKDFMINYRVDNLVELVGLLKKENVTIVDSIEVYEYGKFLHIMDIEGNKIQLWEPIN